MKLALGLVSIMYCLILAGQHYFMYQTPADKLGRIEEGESGGGSLSLPFSLETSRHWRLRHGPNGCAVVIERVVLPQANQYLPFEPN